MEACLNRLSDALSDLRKVIVNSIPVQQQPSQLQLCDNIRVRSF